MDNVCDVFLENLVHNFPAKLIEIDLVNDVINDRANSCTRLLIRTLENIVRVVHHKRWEILENCLLHCAGELCGNHRFHFGTTRDGIVSLLMAFAIVGVSVCSLGGCIPSFSSSKPSLFRVSAHLFASLLMSLMPVCPVWNEALSILIFLACRLRIVRRGHES